MLTVCYNVTAGNETENAACRDEDVERHEDPIKFLLFPMSALFVSVLTQMICSKFQINVPVTVVLFIYGLLLGLIADQTPNFALGEATMSWTNANPHLYFYTVLPLLVFNDSLHLPMHTFFKIFNSATLLATVGVAIHWDHHDRCSLVLRAARAGSAQAHFLRGDDARCNHLSHGSSGGACRVKIKRCIGPTFNSCCRGITHERRDGTRPLQDFLGTG